MEPAPKRRRMPAWLPQALGCAIAAICLLWVLHGYPIRQELLPAIREIDWKWIAVAVIANLAVYVVHAWRWNTLLEPVVRHRLWPTTHAVYVGLFADIVLPLRVGEIIRCYLLAHGSDLRISLAFASAALERLIDGFWMVVAFLLTLLFVKGIPRDLTILVEGLGAVIVLGGAGLAWIVFHKRHVHSVIKEGRWASTLRHIVEGVHLMGSPQTILKTTLISLAYLALQIFFVYACFKADLMDLSFWAAGAVLAIIRLWTVVPNAPGNIGLVNAACVSALQLLEVEPNAAKTFSIIYFAALTAPQLIAGGIAVALTGVSITELRDRARRGMRAMH